MNNIILYWMRGTGKSTIWKLLAKILQKNCIDLDEYIKLKIGDISQYIEKKSWDAFRDIEHMYLKEILEKNSESIISLWWGTITFDRNSNLILKNNSKVIYIYSRLEDISKRIEKDEQNAKKRNSLTWKWIMQELSEVYQKRKDIYEKFYDIKVENNEDVEESVEKILYFLNK